MKNIWWKHELYLLESFCCCCCFCQRHCGEVESVPEERRSRNIRVRPGESVQSSYSAACRGNTELKQWIVELLLPWVKPLRQWHTDREAQNPPGQAACQAKLREQQPTKVKKGTSKHETVHDKKTKSGRKKETEWRSYVCPQITRS